MPRPSKSKLRSVMKHAQAMHKKGMPMGKAMKKAWKMK